MAAIQKINVNNVVYDIKDATAQSTAEAAQTAATTAQSTAEAAQTAATTAQSTAEAAQTAATDAKSYAESINVTFTYDIESEQLTITKG